MNTEDLVRHSQAGLDLYRFSSLEHSGLDLVITSRAGGVSVGSYASLNLGSHVGDDPKAVTENRARLAGALGVSTINVASQVHGRHVVQADDLVEGIEADGIVVDPSDPASMILVADCVPIALVQLSTRRCVLVHAGWRGLANGIISAASTFFDDEPMAYVGPSISRAAYQVGPDVADYFGDVSDALWPDEGDRSRLDLRAVAHARLVECGVSPHQITLSSDVTDGGATFFSDRAQRPCGRFAMVARWSS